MRAPTSATIGDRTSATGGTLRMLTAPVKFTFTLLLGAETGAVPVGVRGPSCPHVSVGRCGDQGCLAVAGATLGVARIGRVAGDWCGERECGDGNLRKKSDTIRDVKNDCWNVHTRVTSNETKPTDRRRKRAALRISVLKLSCEYFLAGRRFAGALG